MRNVDPHPQRQIESHDFHSNDSDDSTSQSESSQSETLSQSESDNEFEDSDSDDPIPLVHVLGLLRRKSIQFSAFCEIEKKWERSSGQIEVAHPIDSCRDAIMIPIGHQIMIFHMRSGSILHAEHLTLGSTTTMEKITLPNNVVFENLALFCHMNDMIYCFGRADQQYYHG